MNINLRELTLTAYALGELEEPERSQLEAELAHDAEARAFIDEVRLTAGLLTRELSAEAAPGFSEIHRLAIAGALDEQAAPQAAGRSRSAMLFERGRRLSWTVGMAAALLFLLGSIAGIMLATYSNAREAWQRSLAAGAPPANDPVIATDVLLPPPPPAPSRVAASPHQPEPPRGATAGVSDNPYVLVTQNPLSTFAVNVSKAGYAQVRAQLERGVLPARGSVRIEELINAFDYGDAPPASGDDRASGAGVVRAHAEVHPCPWNDRHLLARIALKGSDRVPWEQQGDAASPRVVARDMAVRLEFNPAQVAAFRLIGFESRPSSRGGHAEPSASEVAAGHAVTALYEIVPRDQTAALPQLAPVEELRYQTPKRLTPAAQSDELLMVTVRYRPADASPDAPLKLAQFPVHQRAVATPADTEAPGAAPSADFEFAAAVAGFGLLLRDSPYQGEISFEQVAELAAHSMTRLASGTARGDAGVAAPADAAALQLSQRRDFLSLVERARALSVRN